MSKKVLKDVVETLDAFEEHAGVRLSAVSAVIEDHDGDTDYDAYLEILGEVRARDGMKLHHSVAIVASVYDASGQLVANSEHYLDAENFFGFETFEITVIIPRISVGKVRVIPKVND